MDWIRSSYSTSMYSFDPATGAMVPFPVTWYFAPSGATPLGVHHQYGSLNWIKGTAYPDQVGEIIGAGRPWSNGAAPPGVLGTQHCGSAWTGKLSRLAIPLGDNDFDQPACCAEPSLCQPFIASAPQIDDGDGLGLQPMASIGGGVFRRLFGSGGSRAWYAKHLTPACLGHAQRWQVRVGATTAGFNFATPLFLYNYDASSQLGSWYANASNPWTPGLSVVLLG